MTLLKENKIRMEYEIEELKARNFHLEEKFKNTIDLNRPSELNDEAKEYNDNSAISDNLFSQSDADLETNEVKETHKARSTISAAFGNKNSSPEVSRSKNKYYKKYLQYKRIYLDLQAQNAETKDRAISSLVDKEKKIIKLNHDFEIKEAEYQEIINELKTTIELNAQNSSELSSTLTDAADGLTSKLSQSNEFFLKQKLHELKIDKENIIKKLNFDFQELKAKYDEDVEYYKSLVVNQQPRDSYAEDDPESSPSPQKAFMLNKIIDELRENEEHYIKNES